MKKMRIATCAQELEGTQSHKGNHNRGSGSNVKIASGLKYMLQLVLSEIEF